MPLPKHLPALGGMRFISALLVFTSHISTQPFFKNTEINSALQPGVRQGRSGRNRALTCGPSFVT